MPNATPINLANYQAMPVAASPMSASMPALMVLFVMLTIAVYMELKESRIPNWLTLTSMALGLLIAYLNHALPSSLAGLAIGFGFLFIFYVFGGVGGGDVKLMGAAGALMGLEMTKPALFYTTFIGALIAIMMFIWRKDFWQRMGMGLQTLAFWQKRDKSQVVPLPAIKVPYGIAIAIGCVLALLGGGKS
jgi:prepilin peptidase CpaA